MRRISGTIAKYYPSSEYIHNLGGRVLSFPGNAVVSDAPSQALRRAANLAVGQAALCLEEGKMFEVSEAMRLLLSQDA
jgi:hypothetical protein